MISRHDIHVKADAICWQPGVNHGNKDAYVVGLSITDKVLAIHMPGIKYWSGIGSSSYARAEMCICTYEKRRLREGGGWIFSGVDVVLEFPRVKKDAIKDMVEWIKKNGG